MQGESQSRQKICALINAGCFFRCRRSSARALGAELFTNSPVAAQEIGTGVKLLFPDRELRHGGIKQAVYERRGIGACGFYENERLNARNLGRCYKCEYPSYHRNEYDHRSMSRDWTLSFLTITTVPNNSEHTSMTPN